MPTKAELYAQMAEKVATQLTGGRNGQGFSPLLPAFTSTRSMSS
ncbi:hypothetical protein [Enterocloster bolteae]|nr:hypothetical protein [Enterocloster bolteae]